MNGHSSKSNELFDIAHTIKVIGLRKFLRLNPCRCIISSIDSMVGRYNTCKGFVNVNIFSGGKYLLKVLIMLS